MRRTAPDLLVMVAKSALVTVCALALFAALGMLH